MAEKEKNVGAVKKDPKKYDAGKGSEVKKVEKPKKDEKYSVDQKNNKKPKK